MLSKSKSHVIEIIKYRKVPKIRKETCLYRKFIVGILPLHLLNGQRETKFSYSIRDHVLRVEYVQRWSEASIFEGKGALKKSV